MSEPPTEDYEDLYENAPCGYLSLQTDGRIVKVNATIAAWLGFPAADMPGKRVHDILTIAGRIFYETHFAPMLRMQGVFNEVALDLVTQQGNRLPVLVNATERRDAEGRHVFTRLTIFNATDRRRYERDLLAAKAEGDATQRELKALHEIVQASLLDERASSALREQFIAVLGHDLRNPLASINSGMHLLRATPLNPRATAIVGMVENSVVRMAELIDNVMDFARGRLGGGLTLNRNADAPLAPVLEQIVTELQVSAPDQIILCDFAITDPVDCDRRRLGQLASNLLANAITHGGAEKPIQVSARTEGGCFELTVTNGGAPITADVMASMFQPFSRSAIRPGMEGLGLGLYISHEIATAHGGTLTVTSSPEETRFTFHMKLREPG